MKLKISILIFFLFSKLVWAEVVLPNFFTDNMVLQRDKEIPIWGFAKPYEKVSISFKKQIKNVVADANGNWMIKLNPENFGGPFEMKISGENDMIIKNILIGDVFIASGQSNMEWTLAQSQGYQNEVNQNDFPNIREIKIEHQINTIPQNNVLKTVWKVANSQTIGNFSGVAYFFAKRIYNETKIPIGIINSSWGGTNVETWIPREAFESNDYFKEMISKMPKISIDELQKKSSAAKVIKIESQIKSKIKDFNVSEFLNPNLDENQFGEISQPLIWEAQGLDGLDGIVWIRKTINLTTEDLVNDATIFLGKIDDQDVTYFNGVEIGSNSLYDADRKYNVPKDLLKVGKNTIIVKITDTGGGGGIWGGNENVKLVTSKNTISLAGKWKMAVENIQQRINENEFPSLVYNAMIAPLVPYAVKGFIWYQGESNVERAAEYKQSFPLLIQSFREKFGENLPFYFVQLATFNNGEKTGQKESPWAELREAQTNTFLNVKNTGMVVTTDVGNPKDIHPTNKKAVGERLANLFLNNGKVSPIYKNFKIKGNKIVVRFSPEKNLKTTTKNGNISGFQIAGSDRTFHPAHAKIIKNNRVEVANPNIKNPVAVRFGWKADATENNLFTVDDLPVSPFRTDEFLLVTETNKYKIIIKNE